METPEQVRQQVIAAIQQLPDQKLQSLLDYVNFLLTQSGTTTPHKKQPSLDLQPDEDPLLEMHRQYKRMVDRG